MDRVLKSVTVQLHVDDKEIQLLCVESVVP